MSSQAPKRRIRIEFNPQHPVACFMAPAEVIARFIAALQETDYVATVDTNISESTADLPCWKLWVWP